MGRVFSVQHRGVTYGVRLGPSGEVELLVNGVHQGTAQLAVRLMKPTSLLGGDSASAEAIFSALEARLVELLSDRPG